MNKMSGKTYKVVNVVPAVKIKEEVVEDEDDGIFCRLCSKNFANEVALRNHARVEHIDAFLTGNPCVWTQEQPKSKQNVKNSIEQNEIKQKTNELISSMEPTRLTSLASEDVSYIIIKDDAVESIVQRKRKFKEEKLHFIPPKKEKQPPPITGPFECLQPSNLVADGTCHQIFFSCCEYSAHFRDEHTRRRKGLRCQVCEKPLLSVLGEEPQAPYPCQMCGEGYQSNKELTEHINTAHIKLKPYECSVCHKRFTQQGGVQQHMRMHTGDRPFPCTFCPKAFTQKSGLDQHVRIHTKVKPYRCVVCDKSFCQSIHLKQHMRTHTQVSPFQCVICQKRFKQSSHLNYHLRAHNAAAMTDEQRKKYNELLGMINHNEVVEVEIDQSQVHLQFEEGGEEVEEVEESQEAAVEVQSGQENSSEAAEYILGETGEEVWSVQIV